MERNAEPGAAHLPRKDPNFRAERSPDAEQRGYLSSIGDDAAICGPEVAASCESLCWRYNRVQHQHRRVISSGFAAAGFKLASRLPVSAQSQPGAPTAVSRNADHCCNVTRNFRISGCEGEISKPVGVCSGVFRRVKTGGDTRQIFPWSLLTDRSFAVR